jgi:hypothetical protein
MDQRVEVAATAAGEAAAPAEAAARTAADQDKDRRDDGAGPAEGLGAQAGACGEGSPPAPVVVETGRGLKAVCRAFLETGLRGVTGRGASPQREVSGERALGQGPQEPDPEARGSASIARLPGEEGTAEQGERAEPVARIRPATAFSWSACAMRRRPAFAAIAVAALTGVSFGAVYLVSGGGRAESVQAAGGALGGSPGVVEKGVMAPSAKLAMVPPREPVVAPVKEAVPRKEKRELIEEIKSFGQATAKLYDGAAPIQSNPAPGAVASVGAHPAVPGPQEVGVSRPPLPAPGGDGAKETAPDRSIEGKTIAAVRQEDPAPAIPGQSPAGQTGAKRERLARDANAAPMEARPSIRHPGEMGAGDETQGADRAGVQVAVARPGNVREEVASAHPETAAATRAEEMSALALVTKLGTMVADAEKRFLALQSDHDRLRRVVEDRLGELEYRVTFAEAKNAVEAAQVAATAPAHGEEIHAPAPVASLPPLPPGRPAPADGKPRFIKAKAEWQAAPLPSVSSASPVKYRVQAASPHLAMLAELERSGDQGAQIEVAVGDQVSGYGRVTKIVQRGTAWVVVTDRGSIQ